MVTLAINMRDFDRAAAHFGRVARDQLPFAISKTINNALFDARKGIVPATFNRAFDMHNRSFPRATIRVDKASKAELKGSLFDALGRASLALHADGGVKTGSGRIAIPVGNVRAKRGARGIPKAYRPRNLEKKFGANAIRVTDHGIFRGEGGRLHPVYLFESSVKIRERFAFYEDFERFVLESMGRNFAKNLRRAIMTAR